MSVATELKRLRAGAFAGGAGAAHAYVPSVLVDSRAAARTPRAEVAGAALNALESLSAGDASLPSLARPLLLHDAARGDRGTLPPAAEAAASRAVVVAAHRLAPVFPLRPAQKVLEWVVRGLEAGRLGADEEVDALLVCALPFHASAAFVRLATAVLLPSRARAHWKWLRPAVEQRKPVALAYVVKNAHAEVFRMAARQLAASAVAGVVCQQLATFVASAGARRLLEKRVQPLEKRALVLAVLEALCMKRKRFAIVSGKRDKRAPAPPAVVRAVNRAKVAFLVVLATAVTAGVEDEIAAAILHAAVETLTASATDQTVRATAASLLVLCLTRSSFGEMPPAMALRLAKWGQFDNEVAALQMGENGEEAYGVYLAALAKAAPKDKQSLSAFRDGIATPAEGLVTGKTVERAVAALLDACSPAETSESPDDLLETVVGSIQPIARGAHATSLDSALRRHFDGRRKGKGSSDRYAVVDKALAQAMAGTPYVAVKTSLRDENAGGCVQDTLLGCLEHPEASVRLAGLRQLAADSSLAETARGTKLADTFRGILMRRISVDSDLRVAAFALSSGLVDTFCDTEEAVLAVGKRYRDVRAGLSEKKKAKLSARVNQFCEAAFAFCCKASAESRKLRISVTALLVGLDLDDALPPVDARANLTGIAELAGLKWATFAIPLKDMEPIVTALFSWHNLWGLRYVKNVFPGLKCKGQDKSVFLKMATAVFKSVISDKNGDEVQIADSAKCILSSLNSLPKLDDSDEMWLKKLWVAVADLGDKSSMQALIKVICVTQGPERLYSFLEQTAEALSVEQGSDVALEWRAALLKFGTAGGDQSSLVRQLFLAAYSSDENLRQCAWNVCKQLRKKDLVDVLPAPFLRLLVKLKDAVKKAEHAKKDYVEKSDELTGRLLSGLMAAHPRLQAIPKPLTLDEKCLATVLSWAKPAVEEEDSLEKIAAVVRVSYSNSTDAVLQFVLECLSNSLFLDEPIFENDTRTENLLRLAIMMPSSTKQSSLSPCALSTAKLLISRVQELQTVSSSGNATLYGMAVLLALFKMTALLRSSSTLSEECNIMASSAVACLFSASTLSSSIGEFAVVLISPGASKVVAAADFERITSYLNGTLPLSATKRRKTRSTVAEQEPTPSVDSNAAATGALEALARINVSPTEPAYPAWTVSTSVLDGMWLFIHGCLENIKSGNIAALEDCEYQLRLVLRVIAAHFDASEGKKTCALGADDATSAVQLCFYPTLDYSSDLTMVQRGIRVAAISLLEVLAKTHSKKLQKHVVPFLKTVVTSGNFASTRQSFAKIVSLLLQGGFPVLNFVKMAMNTDAGGGGLSVTECIRMSPNRKEATSAALTLVKSSNATRCLNIILESGNSVEDTIAVLGDLTLSNVATISLNVLGHPRFLAKLDSFLQAMSGNEAGDADVAPNFSRLDDLFVLLFNRIVSSEESVQNRSLSTLLEIIPGHLIVVCLQNSLKLRARKVVLLGVQAIVQRLENMAVIPNWWTAEQTQSKRPAALERMCIELREHIESSSSSALSEVGLAAVVAINKIILRIGSNHPEEVQRCGGIVAGLLSMEHIPEVTSSILLCLSSIVRALGRSGSVFVPCLSRAAMDLLELVLSSACLAQFSSSKVSEFVETGVQVCIDALDVAPKMFGKKEVNRLARIAVASNKSNISELLRLAVTKVSSGNAIGALRTGIEFAKEGEADASAGIEIAMSGVSNFTQCLRKSEVKSLKMDLLQLCLLGLDYRAATIVRGGDDADDLVNCEKVEEACFSSFMELVLRVPESDFKVLFNKISSWSEGFCLPEDSQTVLKEFEVEASDTIMRFVPVQGLCVKLFKVLRGIMCPYFAGILDRSLKAISSEKSKKAVPDDASNKNQNGTSSKKRKRKTSLNDGRSFAVAVESMRCELVKSSLESVELFLRHVSDEDEVSTATLRRIQDGILSAFDVNGEATSEVQGALCALALRMLVTGTYRTKEQSRQLLCGLSRSVLQRAGNDELRTRRGSLVLMIGVAEAVGDELLVALPEAMPVLADVVDDEKDEVAKAAKLLVSKLENLSGEPILDQLK